MKLKFLLWIAAAVAAVVAGVIVLTPKSEKTEESATIVETPAEESAAPVVEETPVVSAEDVAAKEAEEQAKLEAEKRAKEEAAAKAKAQRIAKAKAEKAAAERAAKEAAEKAEAERVAKEEAEKAAAEAEAARLAQEVAAKQAEAERLAKEEAEKAQMQAQQSASIGGGLKGRVLSRGHRSAVGNAAVTIDGTDYKAVTNDEGYFVLQGVPAGDYKLSVEAAEYENLDVVVKVENGVKDINSLIIVPKVMTGEVLDDAIFAEFDNDS